jgi:RimJ/RimL family protein N-acetyltransferase
VVEPLLILRDVRHDDVDAYLRMRADPVMMAELGGPRPRAEVLEKVQRDVLTAESGQAWILMVVPEGTEDVAGSVVVWTNRDHDKPFSEIGWMILPEYQGQGLAKASVRVVLDRARREDRWGVIHAYPSVTNGPSNGVCRALGFVLVGEEPIEFVGQHFVSNHWRVDPGVV